MNVVTFYRLIYAKLSNIPILRHGKMRQQASKLVSAALLKMPTYLVFSVMWI
jgi:hypothetical protein